MTVLDTFYLLFKSNASDAIKGNQAVSKSSKELKKDLNETNDEAEKLGKNFVKIAENATSAATAMFSVAAIRSGILNTAAFNSNLEVQGKLMGQNVQDIKAWGAAVQAAGGTVEGFQSALKQAFTTASNAGLPLPPVDVLMQRYHDAIRGLSKNQAAFRLGQLGVDDPGMQSLLQQSDEDFAKSIAAAKEHARVTQADTEAAREFEGAWSKASQSLESLYTKIGSDILPAITTMVKGFTAFTDSLQDNKAGMYGFFGGMIILATSAAAAVGRLTASLLGLGGAASGAGALAALSRLGLVGTGAAAAGAIITNHQSIADWIDNALHSDEDAATRARYRREVSSGSTKAAMDFYMSQGLTRAQAAGIVANEQRESGGNPSARGDGGLASGLYQWHPDRAAAILAGSGIDVTSASADDQRRAALWEMQKMGILDKIRATNDPDAAAALFSSQFERPANGAYEAALRGKSALALASSTPFSSTPGPSSGGDKSVTIKIDEINVHTQATDASGISQDIGQQLNSHLRTTVANFDDGIAR